MGDKSVSVIQQCPNCGRDVVYRKVLTHRHPRNQREDEKTLVSFRHSWGSAKDRCLVPFEDLVCKLRAETEQQAHDGSA